MWDSNKNESRFAEISWVSVTLIPVKASFVRTRYLSRFAGVCIVI